MSMQYKYTPVALHLPTANTKHWYVALFCNVFMITVFRIIYPSNYMHFAQETNNVYVLYFTDNLTDLTYELLSQHKEAEKDGNPVYQQLSEIHYVQILSDLFFGRLLLL